jgi:hypothetical protein
MREQPARSAQIIPGRLWSVIERCLAKAPAKRYENITDARAELLGTGRRAGLLPNGVGDSVTYTRFLLAVLFCLLVVGLYVLQRSRFSERSRVSSPSAALPTTKHYNVVAVPAFRNLSVRASDEWVGTALAGMLCSELASSGKVQTLSADRLVISGRAKKRSVRQNSPFISLMKIGWSSKGAKHLGRWKLRMSARNTQTGKRACLAISRARRHMSGDRSTATS